MPFLLRGYQQWFNVMNTAFTKIVGINLLVFTVYTFVSMAFKTWLILAICFSMHVLVCFFLALSNEENLPRKAFFMSLLLILLIGFGTCTHLFSKYENTNWWYMTRLQKIIIGINLLFLATYTVISYNSRSTNHLAIVGHAFVIACHICTLIFIAIIAHFLSKKEIEKAFWLSSGVILLIGFGSCLIVYN